MTKTENLKKQIVKRSVLGLNRTSTVCKLIDLYKPTTPSMSERDYFFAMIQTKTSFVCFTGSYTKKSVVDKIAKKLGYVVTSEKIDYRQYKYYVDNGAVVL